MDNLIYIYLALFLSSAAGFAFGAFKYLRPHKPLYASMISLGIGCVMIGRAYSFLRLLTGLQVTGIFHVGMLGTVGAFAFFFSANFGQIDSLVDGGEKQYAKYRLAAVTSVIVTAALYTFILLSPASIDEKVADGIVALMIAAASYFHLKHIIIPDIDYGVVRCQRGYNALALIYGVLCMLEMGATSNRMSVPFTVICVLECVVTFIIIPVMDRGVKKWSK